jgi:large repetitive protein
VVPPAPVPPAPVLPTPNAAPSFSVSASKTALEDSGAHTLTNWVTAISPGAASEAAQNVTFTVTADTPALFAVQPTIDPSGKLTFTSAANAHGVATVTVTAIDDGGTANGGTNSSEPSTFTITVLPVNDAPTFSGGANQTVLEDSGAQSVAGWATAMSPGPPNESSQTVGFTASADTPSLFSVQPAVAPDGTLTYTLAPDDSGVATITVTAVDNGGTANGGSNSSNPQTFTVTIILVNHAPTFTVGADQAALEDAGAQSIPGWATAISKGPANEASQNVTFTVSADTPALFAVQPTVAANGTLTYTTAANANGLATITVTAVDDGGTANGGTDTSASSTFTITLTAVNDAPTFSTGSDQTVISLLGAQSIAGWATGITSGPADEASQNITFIVINDNPGLFSTQPAIAPNGRLTFAPTLLALGVATVTVQVVDNGGTANGGSDTSAPQTFTITIL